MKQILWTFGEVGLYFNRRRKYDERFSIFKPCVLLIVANFASLSAFLLQPTNIFIELLFVFLDARGTNCCTTGEDITKMLSICSLVVLQCGVPLCCRVLKVSETIIRKRENSWTIHNNTDFHRFKHSLVGYFIYSSNQSSLTPGRGEAQES